MHARHVNLAMWEIAPLLDMDYHALVYPPLNAQGDMNVTVSEVVKVCVCCRIISNLACICIFGVAQLDMWRWGCKYTRRVDTSS